MSERVRISYRIPPETVEQISELQTVLKESATSVVVRAINELHQRQCTDADKLLILASKYDIDVAAFIRNTIAAKSAESPPST